MTACNDNSLMTVPTGIKEAPTVAPRGFRLPASPSCSTSAAQRGHGSTLSGYSAKNGSQA
jgi:hypothetical protein